MKTIYLHIATLATFLITVVGLTLMMTTGNAPGFMLACGFPLFIFFGGGSFFTFMYVFTRERKVVTREEYEAIRRANAKKVNVG